MPMLIPLDAVTANLERISKCYLSFALNSDQTNSVYDYIDALAALTSSHPTVWTEHYKSNTTVHRRLRQFLKKGSQSGTRDYWPRLTDLFRAIPRDALPNTAAEAAELLNALQSGIVRKEEPKYNHEAAFGAYVSILTLINGGLPNAEEKSKLLQEMALPILAQYVQPSIENSQWSIPSSSATSLLNMLLNTDGVASALAEVWPQYSKQLIDAIKTLAPEQAKDYDKSQTTVAQHATRYATVQQLILHNNAYAPMQSVFAEGSAKVMAEAIQTLKSRNGKPYGAAAAVAAISKPTTESQQQLETFLREDIQDLLSSPSATYLIDLLYASSDNPAFQGAWNAALKAILKSPESPARTKSLEAILASPRIPPNFDLAASDPELQAFISANVRQSVEGSAEWDSFNRVLQSPAKILAPETTDDILAYLTQSLSVSQHAPYSLQGLRHIVKSNPALLKDFVTTPQGSKLLQCLLLASESPDDEVAQNATAVNASIQTILASGTDTKQSMFDLIQQGLREASPTSVSVETLVDLAKQSVKSGQGWDALQAVFPSIQDWNAALASFLSEAPKSSLAITNPLGGAVYLVTSSESMNKAKQITRDADGYSAAYRMTQYVTRLLKDQDTFPTDTIPAEARDVYLRNIALTVQLADDNLGLAGANALWADYNVDVETDAMAFISDAQTFISQELQRRSSTDSTLSWATELLASIEISVSPPAYYSARTYSVLIADVFEMSGWRNAQTPELQAMLKTIRAKKAIMPLLAFLNALKEPLAASKSCERMCNEIIADLTGLDIESKTEEGLRQLVQLNTLFGQEGISESIAKQRLVFFVKHMVPWLQNSAATTPVKAELCRALSTLLPLMSDMYGEHWAEILNSLAATWASTNELEEKDQHSPIPFVHASLKLYAQLRTLTQTEEPNDDLVEAWKDTEQPIAAGLINLLKHSQHFPDEFHQPLKMVNDVLARQIAKVSLKHLESTEELFPLLYVESQPVQQTAFDILHKQIPLAQEQISIDSALEKTTARLPEELLSLILDAPTTAGLADAHFDRSVPLQLRGYLLSWLLVFDHLEHASFKVKNDYVEHIKEGEYLRGLLNFTFDFLGHAHNKPVDVSKLDVTTYKPDVEPPKRDLQWLLTHLYFLCLRHVPSLTKSWFIDCKSRATVVTLEPWTEKFVRSPHPVPSLSPQTPSASIQPTKSLTRPTQISPPVISAALASVTTWTSTQDPDSPFTVRVAPRAREITASYLVDDATMAMRISLPAAFPLASAGVASVQRVAVTEMKWQSWLRTSLGAINIFNGSLIDALTTFKRNVDGAMKGQTECAICYSIISADRKVCLLSCIPSHPILLQAKLTLSRTATR